MNEFKSPLKCVKFKNYGKQACEEVLLGRHLEIIDLIFDKKRFNNKILNDKIFELKYLNLKSEIAQFPAVDHLDQDDQVVQYSEAAELTKRGGRPTKHFKPNWFIFYKPLSWCFGRLIVCLTCKLTNKY
ncbi:hypothetical protein BpHYR1_011160 [Brachionus plicatilis]|uniref:Uncharacterized protein n=1 Tax=Brachionus plicatilis TaxID=10195 RepID=A0A3M7S902_BRAPC|nr:hypothetical protein BpHYR1_011160 [Brachionus plicatilis]